MSLCAITLASSAIAQTADDPGATPPTPDQRLIDQLATCREGILALTVHTTDRHRWGELLFTYQSPLATELAAELLSLDTRPEVQFTVCKVLADRIRATPASAEAIFVEPLIHLLGAQAENLRMTAARALADYPSDDVPTKLGRIAAGTDEPMIKRLAAIDALAPNVHRRQVVGQLIHLLEAESIEITNRVVAGLAPVSPEQFGPDIARWRAWWRGQRELSEENWLRQQLRLYRQRSRSVSAAFDRYRDRTRREHSAITSLTRQLQTDLYWALSSDQRPRKLVEWLNTSLTTVQTTALEIIQSRMADEGLRPEGDVLETLLLVLKGGAPDVRRETLLIVQNLSDPPVIDAVLSQLDMPNDAQTRPTVFRALGKLGTPRAIPILIRELEDLEACAECVREAAIALGIIAARADTAASARQAIEPLRRRFESLPTEDVALRSALLGAIAGVADPSFIPMLHGAIESDDPIIIQPAIRGLRKLGDSSRMPRLRTLMGHTDRLVRLAAIDAVSNLGREDADLESILFRLSPSNEPNELVRATAWRAFRDFLARRPMSDRILSSERLRDYPDIELRYLAELAETLAGSNGDPTDLSTVLDRLTAGLIARDKHAEAIPHLRRLFEMHVGRGDGSAWIVGERWIAAALVIAPPREVTEALRRLHAVADSPAQHDSIVRRIAQYLDRPPGVIPRERMVALLAELKTLPVNEWPKALFDLIERVNQRLATVVGPTPTDGTTPGSND